jgi:hypothetical protein
MAVRVMAVGSGKNRAKGGSKITPSPNPEKRVIAEAKKATGQTITYSMGASPPSR